MRVLTYESGDGGRAGVDTGAGVLDAGELLGRGHLTRPRAAE